jgi:hypothetical protein
MPDFTAIVTPISIITVHQPVRATMHSHDMHDTLLLSYNTTDLDDSELMECFSPVSSSFCPPKKPLKIFFSYFFFSIQYSSAHVSKSLDRSGHILVLVDRPVLTKTSQIRGTFLGHSGGLSPTKPMA